MNVFDVAQLFVELTRRDYADEVALIAYYGSRATGTASEHSDLDLYYIPDEGKAASLYQSVVVAGMAFEFWGMSWEFAERIAGGRHRWSVAPSIITNARILYARSEADRARFEALQTRIHTLQQPDHRPQMIMRALDAFEKVPFTLYRLENAASIGDLSGARWALLQTIDTLLDCLALVNQTFFVKHWAGHRDQIGALKIKPAHLTRRIETLMMTDDFGELQREARNLVDDTRKIILHEQVAYRADYSMQAVFGGYYAGIKEYLNKVHSACERHDIAGAWAAAIQIQKEVGMMCAQVETQTAYTEFNPFAEYRATLDQLDFPDLPVHSDDTSVLRQWASNFDNSARSYLSARGIP